MDKWSDLEKKVARRVFESALGRELSEVIHQFKLMAQAVSEPDDLWKMERELGKARKEIDEKYDFRYSQLCIVFGRLIREGRIEMSELQGLSEDKLASIERIVAL